MSILVWMVAATVISLVFIIVAFVLTACVSDTAAHIKKNRIRKKDGDAKAEEYWRAYYCKTVTKDHDNLGIVLCLITFCVIGIIPCVCCGLSEERVERVEIYSMSSDEVEYIAEDGKIKSAYCEKRISEDGTRYLEAHIKQWLFVKNVDYVLYVPKE